MNPTYKELKVMICFSLGNSFPQTKCTQFVVVDEQKLFYYRGNYSEYTNIVLHVQVCFSTYIEASRRLQTSTSKLSYV